MVGRPSEALSLEDFEASLREARAQQTKNDMKVDLEQERDSQAKRAIRARAHRRLAALAPHARSVHCDTVLGPGGGMAITSDASARLLASHWRQVFDAPAPLQNDTVQRLLKFAQPLHPAVELEPFSFEIISLRSRVTPGTRHLDRAEYHTMHGSDEAKADSWARTRVSSRSWRARPSQGG